MRQAQELSFASFDGQNLFYRHWPALGEGPRPRAIVLLHRGHEHSGRLQHLADELGMPDTPMFAWDARGHGRNEGPRGYSPSLGSTVRDLDAFIRHLCLSHGLKIDEIVVIAQSVGAVLAATWAHDYAPRIRALLLASPAFKVKLYVPFARPGLKLLYKLRGNFFVNSYVKARFLSHDPERIASYDSDPLITRPISANILLALYDTAERIVADAGAITVPTQLLVSGADFVVHKGPQQAFFNRLGSSVKEMHELPGFYHDTLGELGRALALDKIRAFIAKVEASAAQADLTRADQGGYTAAEFQRLQQPRPWWSPQRWNFALTRLTLATIGRLSAGIRLGWQTGFDSGSTLDYVYRNRAEGVTPIGKLGDRAYLDSVGWKGIRQRKLNLEALIAEAAGRLQAEGNPVRLVDIAAGHGRYILDAVGALGGAVEQAQLRDYSEINVDAGRALIRERSLEGRARFDKGDAFDRADLAALQPAPTLAVVSGLYELFPQNEPIRQSLAGLAEAVPPGGYLVYTNQPWHPQLELIARTLTSHRGGEDWIMRRRTQQEMDQLVAAAGFEKLEQRIDEWGVFTVSLARRLGSRPAVAESRQESVSA
ncbi:bifunctional alpha/beta hydrolase/class I SAM-dependent methyltransferase [Chromobacterium vaccinii]|uniref:bifunctional alpha/beta hydrolase/class I SAM-dependent methyltransferase n=1 Tax=Chromobacterium vaccinii TaxID=1108595 RepID=UPI000E18403D|nr:bifunctional alpha/beta hydrolase/class I SAM-dependent methyltransferase [Chromobacterium vaccinii]SUX30129.1 Phospholipase ytpA [Chromobacterium vaccinii]